MASMYLWTLCACLGHKSAPNTLELKLQMVAES